MPKTQDAPKPEEKPAKKREEGADQLDLVISRTGLPKSLLRATLERLEIKLADITEDRLSDTVDKVLEDLRKRHTKRRKQSKKKGEQDERVSLLSAERAESDSGKTG